jgi:hypothetical protein
MPEIRRVAAISGTPDIKIGFMELDNMVNLD